MAEGQVIDIAGLEIIGGKRRGKTMKPAPEEGVDGTGTKSVADALEGSRIGAPAEAVVKCFERNAGLFQLALRPRVAVEPQPDWERSISIGLPESCTPVGIPQIEIKVVDQDHLTAPFHVRMPGPLVAFALP